jgi:hypothetical protein
VHVTFVRTILTGGKIDGLKRRPDSCGLRHHLTSVFFLIGENINPIGSVKMLVSRDELLHGVDKVVCES